jgi:hypothetical protein
VSFSIKQLRELGIDVPRKKQKRGARPPQPAIKGKRAGSPLSEPQRAFLTLCKAHGLPEPAEEYPFAEEIGRKWRFDWVFEGWLALEIQGGLFVEGRHAQGAALLKEHEKLNWAVVLGYSVMFCTPQDVESGAIFPLITKAIKAKEEQA